MSQVDLGIDSCFPGFDRSAGLSFGWTGAGSGLGLSVGVRLGGNTRGRFGVEPDAALDPVNRWIVGGEPAVSEYKGATRV